MGPTLGCPMTSFLKNPHEISRHRGPIAPGDLPIGFPLAVLNPVTLREGLLDRPGEVARVVRIEKGHGFSLTLQQLPKRGNIGANDETFTLQRLQKREAITFM